MKRLLLIPAFLLLVSCGGFVCDSNHAAAVRARSLTQAELAALHAYVYELRKSDALPGRADSRPEIVQKLQPVEIRTSRCGAQTGPCIKLAGCFDEFIFLYFSWAEGQKRIELEWSEGPNKLAREVLWQGEGTQQRLPSSDFAVRPFHLD
ncbi:hypothetical protein [Tahibacter sp.]|uniref:hypothetical protein n=1 Tax=Tahibacter sp. TaxID=2056211 RepID=UPI0028C42A2B|nr:hypothetical protein [Tahibacter sp.]